jgi:hypothetical protein
MLEPFPESTQRLMLLTSGAIARESEVNGVEKVLIAEWLREKLDGAPFHRLHTHWDIAMSSHENNWNLGVRRNEIALEVQSTLTRQSYVENQAGWTIRRLGSEIFHNRFE